jgi:hypothetical protein
MEGEQRRLRKLNDEEWREIPGTEGKYLLSNYGRIKSFHFKKEGQLVKFYKMKNYLAVSLQKVTYSKYVHKLVAWVWLEKPSEMHVHVMHIDGNIRNNYYKNLQWITREESLKRVSELMKEKTQKKSKEELITYSKLNEKDVKLIKSMLLRKTPQHIIAKMFKVSEMQITRIKRGENWAHIQPDPIVPEND